MGREKKNAPGVSSGDHAKERHKKARRNNLLDWTAPPPPGLVARKDRPQLSSKHKSWFELIENKDKKKKLEFEFTERVEPPPGFEFVPMGNPALTSACKELSREQGAMIFIVTSSRGCFSKKLSLHLNRVGHHIRESIVEQARASLGDHHLFADGSAPGQPEPIPERQEDINKQADAALRDLFPRIPHTDRQMIIDHAFNKSRLGQGDPPVGLAADISLSRRAQLAVLAHIRHNHTRYDQLLRETTYINARKTVEALCLDILVKWRGDEETGRDQLDEILCEVIVISDSESDESDDESDEEVPSPAPSTGGSPIQQPLGLGAPNAPLDRPAVPPAANCARGDKVPPASHAPQKVKKSKKAARKDRRAVKWAQRGFSRYQAARDEAWHQAVKRQRGEKGEPAPSTGPAMDRSASRGVTSRQTGQPARPDPGVAVARGPTDPTRRVHDAYGTPLPPVDVHFERGSRVDEQQQTNPAVNYRVPQQTRLQEYHPNTELRPIVGSRTVSFGPPAAERASHHGQDLKDYILPSIEPASPEPSTLPPRAPISYYRHEPGLPRAAEGPVRVAADPRDRAVPTSQTTPAPGYRTAFAEEGFIRLPPRSEPGRAPVIPASHSEPFIILREQPVNAARGNAGTAASSGYGIQHSQTWADVPAGRGGARIPSSGGRPIWIREDGVVLRSASRPIPIPDYPSPPRQLRADPQYVSLENRRHSPIKREPGWVGERDGRYVQPRMDQRVEALQDDFVEIVRVSNKFPRQHEPRPISVPVARYDLSGQDVPRQIYDGVARYDPRPRPMPAQRLERVVGLVEVPANRDNMAYAARQPEGFQRQERVVGIEYVHPPHPGFEAQPYPDRSPFYHQGEPVYRSRSNSVMPAPPPAPQYHTQNPRGDL